jgi:hypothetical protein
MTVLTGALEEEEKTTFLEYGRKRFLLIFLKSSAMRI